MKLFDEETIQKIKYTSFEGSSIKKVEGEDDVFKMTISTNQVDRYDEIVNQEGIDTANYEKNPVVLWGHDYSIPAIGQTIKLIRQKSKTIAHFIFAKTPFAQEIKLLVEGGFIRTSSIGFMGIDFDRDKNEFVKSELLEWSIVNIPANPGALALMAKGIKELKCKEVEAYVCKKGDANCKIYAGVMEELKKLEIKEEEKPENEPTKEPISEEKEEDNTIITEEAKAELEGAQEETKVFYEAKDIDLKFLEDVDIEENIKSKLKGETEILEEEKSLLDIICTMGLCINKKSDIIDEINQEKIKSEKPQSEKIDQIDEKLDKILQGIETEKMGNKEESELIKIASKAINKVLSNKNTK